jgi:RNA polymerase sigma-70 factor (ECF subfamily)
VGKTNGTNRRHVALTTLPDGGAGGTRCSRALPTLEVGGNAVPRHGAAPCNGAPTLDEAATTTGGTSDHSLILAFRAGDDAAFDALFNRYAHQLRVTCNRLLRDEHLAEDVAQEAFTRFVRAIDRVDETTNVGALLHRIASNLCANELRRSMRCLRAHMAASNNNMTVHFGTIDVDQSRQPESAHAIAALRALIVDVAARLPDRERRVMVLAEVRGMSNADVAAEMQVSVAAVEALRHRMRERFKREFVGLEIGPSLPSECASALFVLEVLGCANLRVQHRQRLARHLEQCPRCSASGSAADLIATMRAAAARAQLTAISA